MNRTSRQYLCIFMLLASVLTCFASRVLAQVGWTQPTIMPNPHRGGGGAAVGPDGRIYVIGGQSPANYVGPIDIYDPARNVWTQGASLPTPRNDLGVVTGPDGLIYTIGGANGSGILAIVEAYNVATDTWTTVTSLPKGRHYLNNSVAVGSDGCIYAIGGRNSSGNSTGDVLAYNTKTKTWTTRTSAPYTDYTTSATAGPDGKIYTAFGNGGGSGSPFAAYDPTTDKWTTLSLLPTSRSQMGIVAGQDGRIYVMGGRLYYYAAFTEVDVYDPVTSQWSSPTAMPKQSWNIPVVSIPDGRLFALGTDEPGGAEPPSTRVDVYHLATTDIFPDHGGKGGQITTTILLNGVQEGATVKLTADKVPDIQGTNTKTFIFTNFKGSSRIQTTFNLTGATLGPRYVVITNPDGTVITLPQQFTVEDLKEPKLQTQVIGRSQIRGGAWTTYNVLVQNTGNIDSQPTTAWIAFDDFLEYQLKDDKALREVFKSEGNVILSVDLPSIPTLGTLVLPLNIADNNLTHAHKPFSIAAWINAPHTLGKINIQSSCNVGFNYIPSDFSLCCKDCLPKWKAMLDAYLLAVDKAGKAEQLCRDTEVLEGEILLEELKISAEVTVISTAVVLASPYFAAYLSASDIAALEGALSAAYGFAQEIATYSGDPLKALNSAGLAVAKLHIALTFLSQLPHAIADTVSKPIDLLLGYLTDISPNLSKLSKLIDEEADAQLAFAAAYQDYFNKLVAYRLGCKANGCVQPEKKAEVRDSQRLKYATEYGRTC